MSTGTKAKAFRIRGYYMDVPARSGSDTPATVTVECPGLFIPDGINALKAHERAEKRRKALEGLVKP